RRVAAGDVREPDVQIDGEAIFREAIEDLGGASALLGRDAQIEVRVVPEALLRVAARDRPALDDDRADPERGQRGQAQLEPALEARRLDDLVPHEVPQ